jgi:hypothetical protein
MIAFFALRRMQHTLAKAFGSEQTTAQHTGKWIEPGQDLPVRDPGFSGKGISQKHYQPTGVYLQAPSPGFAGGVDVVDHSGSFPGVRPLTRSCVASPRSFFMMSARALARWCST